jgi:hypothetical protein
MWKCEDCGIEFEEEDMGTYQECVGEFWGFPAYESFDCCPNCSSTDIYEMVDDEEGDEE